MKITKQPLYTLQTGEKFPKYRDAGMAEAYVLPSSADKITTILRFATADKKDFLVVDGLRHTNYDLIKINESLHEKFSLHNDFAYLAEDAKKNILIWNSDTFKGDKILDYDLNPFKKELAYIVREGKKHAVIVNKKKIISADYIPYIKFLPTGDLICFTNEGGKPDKTVQGNPPIGGKFYIVKNGVKSLEHYDDLIDFSCSSNGKNYAFVAKKEGKKIIVNQDGKIVAEYSSIHNLDYNVLDQLVFTGYTNKISYLVVDSKIIVETPGSISNIIWSPNGNTVGCLAYFDSRQAYIINGKRDVEFHDVWNLVINNDGTYQYDGVDNDKRYFIKNGNKGKAYDKSAVISGDYNTIIWVERKKDYSWLIINSTKKGEYWNIFTILFSPNNKRYAYQVVTKENKQYAWGVDDLLGDELEDVGELIFSDDSKHYAYIGGTDKKQQYIFLDNQKLDDVACDKISHLRYIKAMNSFIALGRKDKETFLLQISL